MMFLLSKVRASLGLALAQLRHYRVRTILAVVAIGLAVLSATVLASVGIGVVETGAEKLQSSQQDLWLTGGPIRFAPGTVGGFQNSIVGAHGLGDDIAEREDVAVAAPIAYQTVYVGTDPNELQSLVGVGVPNVGNWLLTLEAGEGFQGDDTHYAGGSYDGPMTHEVIIDPRTAELFDVGVGDTIYVGGTIAAARSNQFTIVGISPTFSQFLGTPTVTVHLSELQTITGTAASDKASMIAVRLESGVDPQVVERDLEAEYPQYSVRTNQEQLQALLRERALVIAAGVTLVILAIIAGITLTANVLALLVYQQREELAALKAAGVSSVSLIGIVGFEAIILGLIGGGIGVGVTPLSVRGVNLIAERVVGFSDLAHVPDGAYLGGFVLALGIGLFAALVAGWRVVRISPLKQLHR